MFYRDRPRHDDATLERWIEARRQRFHGSGSGTNVFYENSLDGCRRVGIAGFRGSTISIYYLGMIQRPNAGVPCQINLIGWPRQCFLELMASILMRT